MEVLDYIDLPYNDPKYISQAVQKFVDERKGLISTLDVTIRISVCKAQETRALKSEREEVLAQLIAISGIDSWEEKPYSFDFAKGKYMVGKQEIHVTASEAVALYQKLVRNQDNDLWAAFYSNMKKRLGQEFLRGVV